MATPEQTQQILNSVRATLSELSKIDVDALIREEELGRDLSFRPGIQYFERMLRLFRDLENLNLEELPYNVLSGIQGVAEPTLNLFRRIQSFSVKGHSNPTNVRDELINTVRDSYDSYFAAVAPWIAYLSQRRPDLELVVAQAKKEVANLHKFAEEVKEKQQAAVKEVEGILASVRQAAAEVGVAQHAIHFNVQADVHKKAANWWLCCVVLLGAGAAGYAWWSFSHAPDPPAGAALVSYYVHYAVPRVVILTILFYGLVWSSRNYSSHRHNEVLNRHRQNALRTFETFVKAATDNQTKDAVLLRATEAIFTPQPTGYISPEVEAQFPSTMVEVLRGTTERK